MFCFWPKFETTRQQYMHLHTLQPRRLQRLRHALAAATEEIRVNYNLQLLETFPLFFESAL